MNHVTKKFQFGDHEVVMETGEIARQTSAAVMISVGDTVVLVSAVGKKEVRPGADFFPLTINYQERTYAAGKIPGGFFKREGRPSEGETLTSRLIDRPLRPLFPKGFRNEVQVIATVVSLDPEIQADVVSMIGASAALACSGMPFQGPIGAARVGYVDGNYVLNPGISKLEESDLDLVVAGTDNAVLMVESEAAVLPEEVMLGAVIFGHEQMQVVINAIREMAAEVGTEAWQIEEVPTNDALAAQVAAAAEAGLTEAYMTADKMERQQKVGEVRDALVEQLVTDAEDSPSKDDVKAAFSTLEKSLVRGRILSGERRIGGRDTRSVRPIAVKTGLLPRVHG